MDLQLKNKTIIVCGATSGFGKGAATALLNEGANIIAIARTEAPLKQLQQQNPALVATLTGDITTEKTQDEALSMAGNNLYGVLVNAGGPPSKSAMETQISDWDEAYQQVMRWKIAFTQKIVPILNKNGIGRLVYVESSSVKQPIENLVLSTAFRMGMTGYIKTLSQELVASGITFNIMAPGFHNTAAVDRIVKKKSEMEKISPQEALEALKNNQPMKKMGNPDYFGSLAAWIFSPYAEYITGQIFTVDGGLVKSSL